MTSDEKTSKSIKDFWDSRANLKNTSGTDDFILKDIEISAIMDIIDFNSDILDVGCGNGKTLLKLIKEKNCQGMGIDFSSETLKIAKEFAKEVGLEDKITLKEATIPNGLSELSTFKYVITQRCLINLLNKQEQYIAFKEIMSHVKPNGFYIMIENSIQGLEELNKLRKMLDLSPLTVPWHNSYFDENDVAKWGTNNCVLVNTPETIASTYYFLSRVIYARLGQDEGLNPHQLKYDSNINMLSYKLPRNIGNWGATKMWIWRKINNS